MKRTKSYIASVTDRSQGDPSVIEEDVVDQENAGYGLIVRFTDESPSFVNGFEAGMIWTLMQRGEPEIVLGLRDGLPIHEANVETVRRMAQVQGYTAEFGVAIDGWIGCRLTKFTRPHLQIVKSD